MPTIPLPRAFWKRPVSFWKDDCGITWSKTEKFSIRFSTRRRCNLTSDPLHGDRNRFSRTFCRRASFLRRHRHRAVALRSFAGCAWRLHVNDDRALRAKTRLVARGDHRFAATLKDSRERLRRLRDKGRKSRSHLARHSSQRLAKRRTARETDGDRGQVSSSPDTHVRN